MMQRSLYIVTVVTVHWLFRHIAYSRKRRRRNLFGTNSSDNDK